MTTQPSTTPPPGSLRARLAYEPRDLKFGTSGRRGEVVHLTQLEIYIDASAELEYMQSLAPERGGIDRGDEFYFAYDLRPSSTRFVAEQGGRGEIAQAVARAIADAGMKPVNLGAIPTPALAFHALSRGRGSMMITGSHIPFDRNGYKANTSRGELMKEDEAPIAECVARVRARLYSQPFEESLFNEQGLFKAGAQELPAEAPGAAAEYIARYTSFFGPGVLAGRKLLAYQHSSVGRDLLVEALRAAGAEVVAAGRSETFVPIDTEAIDDETLDELQRLYEEQAAIHGGFAAMVSTDGDSDRPLILGVDRRVGRLRFFSGDLLGMVTAEYLGADAVVVPISANDGIDRGALRGIVETKTRIGSPYVIAGMAKALANGRTAVCGWEANGGFLTGSAITREGRTLTPLPTRDALLPIFAVLAAAGTRPLGKLFDRLPKRFGRSTLIRNFPRERGLAIVNAFSPENRKVVSAEFGETSVRLFGQDGLPFSSPDDESELNDIGERIESFFPVSAGFGPVMGLNYVDGVRIRFFNGDVVHLRPSGNADEMRFYAVAFTPERAGEIAAMGVAEPSGILRRMEQALAVIRK
jgi:phosphomannomutase